MKNVAFVFLFTTCVGLPCCCAVVVAIADGHGTPPPCAVDVMSGFFWGLTFGQGHGGDN